MLLAEFVGKVARDLVGDLAAQPYFTVEVWPRLHQDGTVGYGATATYNFSGVAIDRSVTGRHPMARDERWWHNVYARQEAELGPSSAARAATLTVFGFDPGGVDAEAPA